MRRIYALFIVLSLTLSGTALAARIPGQPPKPDLDIRLPADEKDRGGFVMRTPTITQRSLAGVLEAEIRGLTLRWDGMSGAPKWMSASPGRRILARRVFLDFCSKGRPFLLTCLSDKSIRLKC